MKLTMRHIVAGAAGVAIVLVLIWYMALFRPQSSQLKSAHATYSAAQGQVSQMQGEVVALEALTKQIPADAAKLSTLQAMVPASPDLHDLLDQLHQLAVGSGVQLTSVSPSAATSGNPSGGSASQPATGLQAINLAMTASGGYPQMTTFLTGLTHLPRSVVVDQVGISSGSGGLTATLTAQVFYNS